MSKGDMLVRSFELALARVEALAQAAQRKAEEKKQQKFN